jgi:hypothetical protein
MLGILSVALGALGLWILVFLSFIPGIFVVAFGVLAFLTSMGLIGRENEHTGSFWAFDRNEKALGGR